MSEITFESSPLVGGSRETAALRPLPRELPRDGWLKNGTWTDDPVERRLTKDELREAYRIWVVHEDIRTGKVKA